MGSQAIGEGSKAAAGDFEDNSTNIEGIHNPQNQQTSIRTNNIKHATSKFSIIFMSLCFMATAITCTYLFCQKEDHPPFYQYQTPMFTYNDTFSTQNFEKGVAPWVNAITKYGIEPPFQLSQPDIDLTDLETSTAFKVVENPIGVKYLYIYHEGDIIRVDSYGRKKLFYSPISNRNIEGLM